MAKRLSYFIRSEGPNSESIAKALEWFQQVVTSKGYIAVPGLRSFDGPLGQALGEKAVLELRSKGAASFLGKEITAVTKAKPIFDAGNSPMLVVYPYGRFLDIVDSVRNVSAMLMLPWRMAEVDEWVRTYNAKELGHKAGKKAEPELPGMLSAAMDDISARVNRLTGVENPADRDLVVQALWVVKEAGVQLVPRDMKAWLISKKEWKPTHASEVAELATEVASGARSKMGATGWSKETVEKWLSRK